MTEREKMLAGQLYDSSDEELATARKNAHDLCLKYNMLEEGDEARKDILHALLPHADDSCYFQGPIFFDYGQNTFFGKNFYANFNLTILDCAPVKIGDDVLFGPNCSVVPPLHPFLPRERNFRFKGDGTPYTVEYAKPIEIGNNCWIASNVTILGGVKIGDGCVIGAGSVVTRDIPAHSLAVGNPCRVIRQITEADALEKQS